MSISKQERKMIVIRLFNTKGVVRELPVGENETVASVIRKSGGGLRLVYEGKCLKSAGATLRELGINNGAEIIMLKQRMKSSMKRNSADMERDDRKTPSRATIREHTKHFPESTSLPVMQSPPQGPGDNFRQAIRCLAATISDVAAALQGVNLSEMTKQEDNTDDDFDPYGDIDEAGMNRIREMGFNDDQARKALALNRGSPMLGVDWLLRHAGEEDTEGPLTPAQLQTVRRQRQRDSKFVLNQQAAAMLEAMGFHGADVRVALLMSRNNQQQACDWLLGDQARPNDWDQDEEEGDAHPPTLPATHPSIRQLLKDTRVQTALANPRTLTALRDVLEDVGTLPRYLSDMEVGPLLLQITRMAQNRT